MLEKICKVAYENKEDYLDLLIASLISDSTSVNLSIMINFVACHATSAILAKPTSTIQYHTLKMIDNEKRKAVESA